MNSFSSLVVSVLLLVPSIGIAIGATITTPSTIKTSERSVVNNDSTEVDNFAPIFAIADEQCECVIFYLCDADKVISYVAIDYNPYRCNDLDVCCKINSSSPLLTKSQPETSDLNQSASPNSSSNTRLKRSSESSVLSNTDQKCGIRGKRLNESSDPDYSGIDPHVKYIENDDTYFGEFPWMVALFKTNENSTVDELLCGAALLSPNVVLTAAHCVNKIDLNTLRVRAGEHIIGDDQNETINHQDRIVDSINIHPNFNPKRLYNDLALIRVNESFHYDTHVNSICAPFLNSSFSAPNSYSPYDCWTSGWGKANIDKYTQIRPKKLELSIVKHTECEKKLRATKLGAKFTLDSSFLCAEGEPGYDSCKGDGGGPLFCATRPNGNKFILVGITSWGLACVDTPRIFASLEANSKWITTEINTMSNI